MKKLLCIALLVFTTTLFGQTERYEDAMITFKQHYNQGNVTGIFAMMESSMQQNITLEKTTYIINTFRKNLGSISSYSFLKKEPFSEVYLIVFENGKQNLRIALNSKNKLKGLKFLPAEDNSVAKIDRNITKLSLPFKGEWHTIWGGDTKPQNRHFVSTNEKNAFDFLKLGKNNKTFERSGTRNEDYFAFGQPLFAVCDAQVFKVIEGVQDNKPGAMNPVQPTGNTVILKTQNEEYILYAHFENGTIRVKEGQSVVQGQYLGNCGNSGNSTEPHLHLHIQDGPNSLTSVGVKCYFESILVNGELQTDYSPIRLDKISRLE